MTVKEQLIREIDQAPDFLLEEVLNFFLFLKLKLSRHKQSHSVSTTEKIDPQPLFLQKATEISQQIPRETWSELPSDLSQNLDHYLYGVPKSE